MTSSSPKILLNREKARLGRFDLVLGLSRSVSSTQLDTLKAKFARSGFDYHLVSDPKVAPQHLLFLAYNNVIGILKAAGRLNIYKKAYTQHLIESKFKLRRVLTEKENKHLDPQIKELEETAKFTFARRKNFLFTPETVQAADKASNQPIISKGEQCAQTGELHVERSESGSLRARLEEKGEYTEDEPFDAYIGLFTPSELCMIISSILNTLDVETADQSFYEVFNVKDIGELRSVSTRLIDHLKRLEVLEFLTPLHNSNISVGLESINNLTDYFGQNVGIYFKFMEHYTKWLIPPAVFGILVFLFSSENHPHFTFALESLYVIMIMIWATLFVEFWQRRSSEICVKWHTYTKQFSAFDSRFDFKGKTRINLVTGMPELYFPLRQKLIRYTQSILAHLPVMLFSFFLMIVFLNAKGYVLPHNKIYMPSLAALSHEGGLFDKKTTWKLIPSILQVTCMVLLARVNKALSFVTTRWENHQTQTGYNNSIIGKRFLFEVLITFLHLFYIVFFRFDFDMLKAELIILFATDEVRRLAMETLVPYVKTKFLGDKKAKTEAEKKNDSKTQETLEQYIEDKVKEINMQDYDEFDDYLEMIVQFGYITLFAAAFPLSGALSLVFNGSEVLSDYYKLGNLYRRPMPVNVNGIGTWKTALDIMSYLCIVSNCVIMGTSPALRSLLSLEAKGSAQAFEEVKDDMGINLLVLEHVVLIVAYLLKTLVRDEPFWVRIYLRRKAHLGNN